MCGCAREPEPPAYFLSMTQEDADGTSRSMVYSGPIAPAVALRLDEPEKDLPFTSTATTTRTR